MKRALSSAGLTMIAFGVGAHDSSVPHTHLYANSQSDLFILGLAALVSGAGAYVLIRLWRRNRQAKVSSPGKRSR